MPFLKDDVHILPTGGKFSPLESGLTVTALTN